MAAKVKGVKGATSTPQGVDRRWRRTSHSWGIQSMSGSKEVVYRHHYMHCKTNRHVRQKLVMTWWRLRLEKKDSMCQQLKNYQLSCIISADKYVPPKQAK